MDATTLKIYAAENHLQDKRRILAESCSPDTPVDRKMFLANHHDAYPGMGEKMASCPYMDIEVLRVLYKEFPYLVSINPQTPNTMMDEYIENGTEQEQLGCLANLAQTKQLSNAQWIRLCCSIHKSVRRQVAKSAAYIPLPFARWQLLHDEDQLVRQIAQQSIDKARSFGEEIEIPPDRYWIEKPLVCQYGR